MAVAINQKRIISSFPQPLETDGSSYKLLDFSSTVRKECEQTTHIGRVKLCKAIIVGDVSVGKTALVLRFCHDVFNRDYKATIGVDFEVEKFSVLSHPFTLQIWDTAGQERFKSIASSYYKGANAIIVAFDLCDMKSLANAETWHSEARRATDTPIVFLVGTKKDMLTEAEYLKVETEALKMAAKLNAEYWPTSSLADINVTAMFNRVVALAFNEMLQRELTSSSSSNRQIGNSLVTLGKDDRKLYERKRKCCL